MSFYISRFKGMESQEFEVEIVTPLFLGGADTKKAELRAPSIKGALRFWWRALYGSDDLKDMKKREDKIFGSTDGKATFSLRLKDIEKAKAVLADLPQGGKAQTESKGRKFQISIIEYLAYGLCEYKRDLRRNVYIKEHIPAGKKFIVEFRFYKILYKEQILNSFKALINFGGLGSHSRNGFGSLKLKEFSSAYKNEGDLKSFTAFCEQTRLFNDFASKATWEDALSEIGNAYRQARNSLEKKHSYVKRPLIAKPLIVKGEVSINERHAKPYFLHVGKFPDLKYRGQILFMPYNYHDQSKRKEYFDACEEMNQKLSQLSGGSR